VKLTALGVDVQTPAAVAGRPTERQVMSVPMKRQSHPPRFRPLTPARRALAGCSLLPSLLPLFGTADKPKPAELQANPNLLAVRQAWTAPSASVDFPLAVAVTAHLHAGRQRRHRDRARRRHRPRALARQRRRAAGAGVGSDGTTAAVVTRGNDLVAFANGKEAWRQKLTAHRSYTAPLVAGARVFVLGADRSVPAFDGATGRRLWTAARPASRWCCASPA
jgi:outer membrane protein assembly factor BamB